MAELDPILVAIPLFFGLIGVELVAARARGRSVYRFADAIADLGCGIGQQATNVFTKLIELAAYAWIFEHLRLTTWDGWTAWIGGFILVDLAFYGWHWASHRVNVMWAAHGVHHQSQDYNLAVALRQEWFSFPFKLPFHLPFALLGLDPLIFFTCSALNTLYQFWIHTELIGKLGPLELVMNTPSHHRVHHGVNPAYIDRNHGGVFIVWDRLFGTFTEESEAPVFGTVDPLQSWSPVWAQFAIFQKIGEVAAACERPLDKLLVWVRPPEWRPEGPLSIPPVDASRFVKWDGPTTPAARLWVAAWFVPLVGVAMGLIYAPAHAWAGLGVAWVVWTLLGWGGLLDGRPWAWPVEGARAVASVAAVAWWVV